MRPDEIMNKIIFAAVLVFGFLGSSALKNACADIPPPLGYVEECTIEKKQTHDLVCESCSTGYWAVEACREKFSGTDFYQVCQTRGGSSWGEVWCKKIAPAGESSKDADSQAPAEGQTQPEPQSPASPTTSP